MVLLFRTLQPVKKAYFVVTQHVLYQLKDRDQYQDQLLQRADHFIQPQPRHQTIEKIAPAHASCHSSPSHASVSDIQMI